MRLILAAAALFAVAAPAAAVTVVVDQSGNAQDIPFIQTTQTFFISSAALSSAVLNIASLSADDAVVVSLNGTALFGAGIFGPGNGNFFFTQAGPSTPFFFAGSNGAVNQSFSAPFVAGNNVLTVTYNNNNAGINSGNGPLTGGPGAFDFDGTVSFIPEPATWGLMIAGFAMTGFAARRRRVALSA